MVSAEAMRPGDVVTTSNGKTIEIVNTDAEGRLTLADALVYAESIGSVDAIIDLATLTGSLFYKLPINLFNFFYFYFCIVVLIGACVVGLGDHIAGVFSNHKDLLGAIIRSSEVTCLLLI